MGEEPARTGSEPQLRARSSFPCSRMKVLGILAQQRPGSLCGVSLVQMPGRAHRRQPGMLGAPRRSSVRRKPQVAWECNAPRPDSWPALSTSPPCLSCPRCLCQFLVPGRWGVQDTGLEQDHTGSWHQRKMISLGVCGPASAASLGLVTPADPPQATVSSPRSRDVREGGKQGQEAEESQECVGGRDVGRRAHWAACPACLHVPGEACAHGDLTSSGSNTRGDDPSLCPRSQAYWVSLLEP